MTTPATTTDIARKHHDGPPTVNVSAAKACFLAQAKCGGPFLFPANFADFEAIAKALYDIEFYHHRFTA